MSRLLVLITVLFALSAGAQNGEPSVTLSQLDAAIEQASTVLDKDSPNHDTLLSNYHEIRSQLLNIEEHRLAIEIYTAARTSGYEEAQELREKLEASLSLPTKQIGDSVTLAELEQMIQVDKSDLVVLQNRLADVNEAKATTSVRPTGIRERVEELGASYRDLESNRRSLKQATEPGSLDEARFWLADVLYTVNRAEKKKLDAELLSQPMRVEVLSARQDKLSHDIVVLENHLLETERRANEMRQGEAAEALAAAEIAQTEALGKHTLVQQLAQQNALFSASLGENSAAIEGFRGRELEATDMAEQFERELTAIERKLDILGMTKTVGEILREQAVRLPGPKLTQRELKSIAKLISASSLRIMALQDERRELRDIQAYVDGRLTGMESSLSEPIREDILGLALNRRELVSRALEVEGTYSLALSDLDFSVHRLANAARELSVFISERLLWIQSRDPLSVSTFAELPIQLVESFSPGRWLQTTKWWIKDILQRPLSLSLFLLFGVLFYLTPRVKKNLVATGRAVGFVRKDAFNETLKALFYTLILMLKWPLLMMAIALPFQHHESDSGLAAALHFSLTRVAFYYFGLELLRCLLTPRGLVESHFRWPAQRVAALNRRVIRFEQTFLTPAFFAALFLALYPTDVGGSVGTLAVVCLLLSLAYFFYRMPPFVQGKMDQFFAEPKAHMHSFWGNLVRTLLAWAPLAMIVAVLFGYTYTAIEFSILLFQTVVLFTGMLLVHELGMRWLRITRRRLKLKVHEEIAHAQDASTEDNEFSNQEETLEHDSELLDDEGTKLLNALLLVGSVVGIVAVWSDVLPALGILDSIELWQSTDVVNGEDLVIQTTLSDVISALILGLLGWVVVRRLPSLFEILLRQRMEISAASAYAGATVLKYGLTIIVVITVLSMLGGSWSQIQWAVAALSLGIGFGLQEIVANFFSGLIILFEQPIRVGDTVTVGDTSGVVTKIQMRATTIRDWDRRELLVPNKEFVTGRLLNWSLTDPVTRIRIDVGVAYGTDMDKALAIVSEAAERHPLILDDPAPFVLFDEFGDNSLVISLRCYLEELEKRLSTASAIRLDINRGLIAAGISVAFPQRDVHLDTSSPLDIRLVNPEAENVGLER